MNTENQVSKTRRAYQVPAVNNVKLRPEEAVLAACKVGIGNGPNEPGGCTSPTDCIDPIS